jgi:hypothetical protein
MPASNFNSAATDSAYFWVRSASGWDQYLTRGYDFIYYLQSFLPTYAVDWPRTGVWDVRTAEALMHYLVSFGGSTGNALKESVIRSGGGTRQEEKAVLLAAVWSVMRHVGGRADWPVPDADILIPPDTIGVAFNTPLPSDRAHYPPRVLRAGRGAAVPSGSWMSDVQAAPVTVISATAPSVSGVPAVTVQTTGGTVPVSTESPPVTVQTSTGVRTMPVTSPDIQTVPSAFPTKTVLLVVGGVILLGGVAYALTKYSQPVTRSRSRARGR